MKIFQMSFDGMALQRGFWLYVWDIHTSCGKRVLYVGRTGDSSSPNAGSPFHRVGQHLNFRPNAKGNSIARNLAKEGLSPVECRFEMTAIGPLFDEQEEFEAHKPLRDTTGRLELKLRQWLESRGYKMIGNVAAKGEVDIDLWASVEAQLKLKFPVLADCSAP